MDTIPNETHAAEVSATIDDLEQGLAQFPLSKAVNRIDDWRRAILVTERAELQPIADGLGELHEALTGPGLDGAAIGNLLVRLGEQTEAAADSVPASTAEDSTQALRNGLKRMGSLLRHAGSALAGNSTE
ncbi:MAG: hypothetical protein HKN04_01830 [Rhodothermaceae bacterium]|nr:hypothetical protein [Rhodothermaceae bacterium]